LGTRWLDAVSSQRGYEATDSPSYHPFPHFVWFQIEARPGGSILCFGLLGTRWLDAVSSQCGYEATDSPSYHPFSSFRQISNRSVGGMIILGVLMFFFARHLNHHSTLSTLHFPLTTLYLAMACLDGYPFTTIEEELKLFYMARLAWSVTSASGDTWSPLAIKLHLTTAFIISITSFPLSTLSIFHSPLSTPTLHSPLYTLHLPPLFTLHFPLMQMGLSASLRSLYFPLSTLRSPLSTQLPTLHFPFHTLH
jgi:hypothetical protein